MVHARKVAKRYAKAFLHEKMGTDDIDRLTGEIQLLVTTLATEKETEVFFISPVYSRDLKIKIVNDICKKFGFSSHTVSLLEILINNDRINILAAVFEELRDVSDKIHGRVRVKLTTADEPSPPMIEKLTEKISGYFGQSAILERNVDSSIIGGFIFEGEGQYIDMSVLGQLRRTFAEL